MSLTHILQEGGPASESQAPQIAQLDLQPGIFEFQIARPGGLIYQALFDRGIVYQDAFEQRHGIDISIRALRHRIPVAALVPYLAHFEQTSQGRYFGGWRILNLSFLGRPGMAEAVALCFQSEDRRWKIVAVGLGEHMEGDVGRADAAGGEHVKALSVAKGDFGKIWGAEPGMEGTKRGRLGAWRREQTSFGRGLCIGTTWGYEKAREIYPYVDAAWGGDTDIGRE